MIIGGPGVRELVATASVVRRSGVLGVELYVTVLNWLLILSLCFSVCCFVLLTASAAFQYLDYCTRKMIA